MKKSLKALVLCAILFFVIVGTVFLWFATVTIEVPLRVGMNPSEVERALKADKSYQYEIWNDDVNLCSRVFLSSTDLFEGHTWIRLNYDSETRLASAIGYQAIGGKLPFVGEWEYSFSRKKIQLRK